MVRLKIYTIFFLLVFSGIINAQQVIIKGNAKSYAGDSLIWKCYEDQITYKEKTLASCKVEKTGDFKFIFKISETMPTFIHLEVFKGILFTEPGKTYEVVLPQKVEKLPEDELNPFFEETEFYVRILNGNEKELNQQIKQFNKLYDDDVAAAFQQYMGRLNKTVADSIINNIEKKLSNGNSFFMNYKKYKYASLQQLAYERNKETLIGKYFHNQAILYQNPAYMEMFNQLFNNYLSHYSKTEKGKAVPYFLMKLKSLKKLRIAMDSVAVLQNDTLQELIISKSLFDNFYKQDFYTDAIIFMMDSLIISASTPQNKAIAQNIKERITKLLIDYIAPDFELPDQNKQLTSLANFRNKFVYLNFINPKSYTCQQELELLKKMYEKKYDMLEIISICICDNIQEMQNLVNAKGYHWKFLYYNGDKELLKDYNVKVYPTYYLINPESRLAMSPAFPPTEPSLEDRYTDILNAWKKELERRKAKEKGLNR